MRVLRIYVIIFFLKLGTTTADQLVFGRALASHAEARSFKQVVRAPLPNAWQLVRVLRVLRDVKG